MRYRDHANGHSGACQLYRKPGQENPHTIELLTRIEQDLAELKRRISNKN